MFKYTLYRPSGLYPYTITAPCALREPLLMMADPSKFERGRLWWDGERGFYTIVLPPHRNINSSFGALFGSLSGSSCPVVD